MIGGRNYGISIKSLNKKFIINISDVPTYINFLAELIKKPITLQEIIKTHPNISTEQAQIILNAYQTLYDFIVDTDENPPIKNQIRFTLSQLLETSIYTGENLEIPEDLYNQQFVIIILIRKYILANRLWDPEDDEFQFDENIKIKTHKYDTSTIKLFFESIGYIPSYLLKKTSIDTIEDNDLIKERQAEEDYLSGGGAIVQSPGINFGIGIFDTKALIEVLKLITSISDTNISNYINKIWSSQKKELVTNYIRRMVDAFTVIRGDERILRGSIVRAIRDISVLENPGYYLYELDDEKFYDLNNMINILLNFVLLTRDIPFDKKDIILSKNTIIYNKDDNKIAKLFLKSIDYTPPIHSL